ncbi:hypothetical protein LRAMOSA00663 [Lichtheimia ramosa]|uniref:Uncharacterized protein n=1 Tax=Lichtheimia ramosa TaxID=688394 RepID=A0A077W869_9FUNG|nr:hypothetical protein LRAMOSA00663 [Lichtheimia ramosa]
MQYHKRVHSPSEYDLLTSEHARKKYITEQVAREMAAMSLSQQDQWQHYNQFTQAPPPPPPQTTTATTNTTPSAPPPPQQQPKESLSKEDQDINLVKTKVNGTYLPLEQRPGDEKLRIPDFILHPNRIQNVRDFARYTPPVKWRLATPNEELNVNNPAEEIEEDLDDHLRSSNSNMDFMDVD